MNMNFYRKLPIPMEIKEQFPISAEHAATRAACVEEMKKIFSGESNRFLLIIGPCSADHEDSVLDYIYRLRKVQDKVADKIMIVPRIYTNKPRTTGDGYKGMLHQPDPNSDPDMLNGLIAIRKLHMRALAETGFGCADEMLYPESPLFVRYHCLCGCRRSFGGKPAAPSDRQRSGCTRGYEKSYGRGHFSHDEFHYRRPALPCVPLPWLGSQE